jgi:hypothetical protein
MRRPPQLVQTARPLHDSGTRPERAGIAPEAQKAMDEQPHRGQRSWPGIVPYTGKMKMSGALPTTPPPQAQGDFEIGAPTSSERSRYEP